MVKESSKNHLILAEMLLIHLITDLGNTDPYLSQFTGQLYKHLQQFRMVSPLTGIKPYDIREGAYVLQNTYRHFPERTIHIAHVNVLEGQKKVLLCEHQGHYFISFDHGMLPLALSVSSENIYELQKEWIEANDPMRFIAIARACSLIERQFALKDIGHIPDRIVSLKGFSPMRNGNIIQAIVIHIDLFGNLVLNINRIFWKEQQLNDDVSILINRMESRGITENPERIEEGDICCYFNSNEQLMVGIRNGSASNMLGIQVDDAVVLNVF